MDDLDRRMRLAEDRWEFGVYVFVAVLIVALFFGQRAYRDHKKAAYKAEIARLELCFENSPPCTLTAAEYDKLTLELDRRQKQEFAKWQRDVQGSNRQ